MVSSSISASTVALRVEVPARGSNENATFPRGQYVDFELIGVGTVGTIGLLLLLFVFSNVDDIAGIGSVDIELDVMMPVAIPLKISLLSMMHLEDNSLLLLSSLLSSRG